MTPENFVKIYLPEAKKVEKKTGFHYLIPLTQGALESGWGKKAVGNNFFGIKDTDGVNGNEQLITTTEYLSTDKVKFPVIIKIVKAGNKLAAVKVDPEAKLKLSSGYNVIEVTGEVERHKIALAAT